MDGMGEMYLQPSLNPENAMVLQQFRDSNKNPAPSQSTQNVNNTQSNSSSNSINPTIGGAVPSQTSQSSFPQPSPQNQRQHRGSIIHSKPPTGTSTPHQDPSTLESEHRISLIERSTGVMGGMSITGELRRRRRSAIVPNRFPIFPPGGMRRRYSRMSIHGSMVSNHVPEASDEDAGSDDFLEEEDEDACSTYQRGERKSLTTATEKKKRSSAFLTTSSEYATSTAAAAEKALRRSTASVAKEAMMSDSSSDSDSSDDSVMEFLTNPTLMGRNVTVDVSEVDPYLRAMSQCQFQIKAFLFDLFIHILCPLVFFAFGNRRARTIAQNRAFWRPSSKEFYIHWMVYTCFVSVNVIFFYVSPPTYTYTELLVFDFMVLFHYLVICTKYSFTSPIEYLELSNVVASKKALERRQMITGWNKPLPSLRQTQLLLASTRQCLCLQSAHFDLQPFFENQAVEAEKASGNEEKEKGDEDRKSKKIKNANGKSKNDDNVVDNAEALEKLLPQTESTPPNPHEPITINEFLCETPYPIPHRISISPPEPHNEEEDPKPLDHPTAHVIQELTTELYQEFGKTIQETESTDLLQFESINNLAMTARISAVANNNTRKSTTTRPTTSTTTTAGGTGFGDFKDTLGSLGSLSKLNEIIIRMPFMSDNHHEAQKRAGSGKAGVVGNVASPPAYQEMEFQKGSKDGELGQKESSFDGKPEGNTPPPPPGTHTDKSALKFAADPIATDSKPVLEDTPPPTTVSVWDVAAMILVEAQLMHANLKFYYPAVFIHLLLPLFSVLMDVYAYQKTTLLSLNRDQVMWMIVIHTLHACASGYIMWLFLAYLAVGSADFKRRNFIQKRLNAILADGYIRIPCQDVSMSKKDPRLDIGSDAMDVGLVMKNARIIRIPMANAQNILAWWYLKAVVQDFGLPYFRRIMMLGSFFLVYCIILITWLYLSLFMYNTAPDSHLIMYVTYHGVLICYLISVLIRYGGSYNQQKTESSLRLVRRKVQVQEELMFVQRQIRDVEVGWGLVVGEYWKLGKFSRDPVKARRQSEVWGLPVPSRRMRRRVEILGGLKKEEAHLMHILEAIEVVSQAVTMDQSVLNVKILGFDAGTTLSQAVSLVASLGVSLGLKQVFSP
ncbi:hypothetical protein HDV05_005879 [Chytridiales sp. JEL 0842]|nr:hypothetical protein HDV05_005879 [Chytridiales sp. JEL 0842]